MKGLRLVLLAALVASLSGCSFGGGGGDRLPDDGALPEIGPDVVPWAEPKSRGGNPKSYVVFGKRYHVMNSAHGYTERGIASWYGQKFHGRRTSNGEIYNMHGISAAHKSLPLPSFVEVTNLRNGRKVILRVNDRGPFHGNRIIDLSYAAARKLDIVRTGTGLVEVRAITPGRSRPVARKKRIAQAPPATSPMAVPVAKPVPKPIAKPALQPVQAALAPELDKQPQLFLQVGAFSDEANAQRLRARLMSLQRSAVNVTQALVNQRSVHRVRVGPLADVAAADQVSQVIVEAGIELPRIVIE